MWLPVNDDKPFGSVTEFLTSSAVCKPYMESDGINELLCWFVLPFRVVMGCYPCLKNWTMTYSELVYSPLEFQLEYLTVSIV